MYKAIKVQMYFETNNKPIVTIDIDEKFVKYNILLVGNIDTVTRDIITYKIILNMSNGIISKELDDYLKQVNYIIDNLYRSFNFNPESIKWISY